MKKISSFNTDEFGEFDEFGNPVERSRFEYPYSYSPFITWRGGKNEEANHTIYSDRILHDDKYNSLCKKHFGNEGQYFSNRSPEKIEAFLKDFCSDPDLKLVFIMELCNMSSGYPIWRFEIKTK